MMLGGILIGFLLGSGGLILWSWLVVSGDNMYTSSDDPYFRNKEFKQLNGYLDEHGTPMIGNYRVRVNRIFYAKLYAKQEVEKNRAKKQLIIDDVKGSTNE